VQGQKLGQLFSLLNTTANTQQIIQHFDELVNLNKSAIREKVIEYTNNQIEVNELANDDDKKESSVSYTPLSGVKRRLNMDDIDDIESPTKKLRNF
jgi:uncharacterized protein YerC